MVFIDLITISDPWTMYAYITLTWIMAICSAILIMRDWHVKCIDRWIMAGIFLCLFTMGAIIYVSHSHIEESPYIVASACMSGSEVFSDNSVCSVSIFGDDKELAWPSLISYFFRLLGISHLIPALLAIGVSSLAALFAYLSLRTRLPIGLSLLFLAVIITCPVTFRFFSTTTKEPLFWLGLSFLAASLARGTRRFVALGIILSFISDIRIQGVILVPVILLVFYKEKLRHLASLDIPFILAFPFKLWYLAHRHIDPTAGDFTRTKLSLDYLVFMSREIFGPLSLAMMVATLVVVMISLRKDHSPLIRYLSLYTLGTLFIIFFSDSATPDSAHYFAALSFILCILIGISISSLPGKAFASATILILLSCVAGIAPADPIHPGSRTLADEASYYEQLGKVVSAQQGRTVGVVSIRPTYFNFDYMLMPDITEHSIFNFYSQLIPVSCGNLTLVGLHGDIDLLAKVAEDRSLVLPNINPWDDASLALIMSNLDGYEGCNCERRDNYLFSSLVCS